MPAINFEILKAQIGIGNLMAVGARDFVVDTDHRHNNVTFKVSRGNSQTLTIKLEADDTYTVTYRKWGRMCTVKAEETREGVYCDAIGRVVRELGDRA